MRIWLAKLAGRFPGIHEPDTIAQAGAAPCLNGMDYVRPSTTAYNSQ